MPHREFARQLFICSRPSPDTEVSTKGTSSPDSLLGSGDILSSQTASSSGGYKRELTCFSWIGLLSCVRNFKYNLSEISQCGFNSGYGEEAKPSCTSLKMESLEKTLNQIVWHILPYVWNNHLPECISGVMNYVPVPSLQLTLESDSYSSFIYFFVTSRKETTPLLFPPPQNHTKPNK